MAFESNTKLRDRTGEDKPTRRVGEAVLPTWTYRSAELAELEYETLIRPSWQFVCHVNQVKNVGDFATLDLKRDSIIVIRNKQGGLNAFSNVCRHRAARLLEGNGNCGRRITCPYHGWSYNLEGDLIGRPSEQTFDGDKSALGLKVLELEVLLGLVFVRIVPGGPSLHEMWADYLPMLEPYRLEEMEPLDAPWIETWHCNWKIAVDNNLENYHIPVGHPALQRLLDTDMLGFINAHGIAGSTSRLRIQPSSKWSERMYQKMAPSILPELPNEIKDTWQLFTMPPNTGLDVMPDSMDVFQILPLGGDRCQMRYPIFVRPDESREVRLQRYLATRIMRGTTEEDRALCENIQRGIGSHDYEFGPLSAYEHCIHDFHRRVRAGCPVTGLPTQPAAGTLRDVNVRMLQEA